MINLQTIEQSVIKDFIEALKDRTIVDPTFLDQYLIDEIASQMIDNLKAKSDLFSLLKLQPELDKKAQEEEGQVKIGNQGSVIDKQSSSELPQIHQGQTRYQQNVDSVTEKQQKIEKQRNQLEQNWQRQYQQLQKISEKALIMSRKAVNLHVAGIYNEKTKRYNSSKSEDRVILEPMIVKTQDQELLLNRANGIFWRGDKQELILIAEDLLSNQENKEYSQEERMLLIDQISKD